MKNKNLQSRPVLLRIVTVLIIVLSGFLTIGCPCLLNPLTLVSVEPEEDATDVSISTAVRATFNKSLEPTTITSETCILQPADGDPVEGVVTYDEETRTITLVPSSSLAMATEYIATVTTGILDIEDCKLGADFSWRFTTVETAPTPPSVTSVTPADDSVDISVSTTVTAVFSKAMNPATLNTSTFQLAESGGDNATGSVSYESVNRSAEFTPTQALTAGVTYIATITRGAKDTEGVSIDSQYSWEFTTEPPFVLGTPSDVSAGQMGGQAQILVEWTAVDGAESYQVYRIVGIGDPVNVGQVTNNLFVDSDFPIGEAVAYRIRAGRAGQLSVLSEASNSITVAAQSVVVGDVEASVLEFDDRIRIRWAPLVVEDVTPSYTVQRFLSADDSSPQAEFTDHAEFSQGADGKLYYDDLSAQSQQPYFYRVVWADQTETPGDASDAAIGFYHAGADDHFYEPNDDRLQLGDSSTLFPDGTELVIYRVIDAGETYDDVDWYVYRGVPQLVKVTVTLPAASELSAQLEFDFYYSGTTTLGYSPLSGSVTNYFQPSSFGTDPPNEVVLFFRLRPKAAAGELIGVYTISVTHEY